MGKSKNEYLEVRANQEMVKVLATSHHGIKDLRIIINRSFVDVRFESDNIFTHVVNGKIVKTLLLRVTATGVEGEFARKRIQVSGKLLTSLPDDIISIYQYEENVIFIRSTNPETLNSMPKNITNLFFTNVFSLKKAMINPFFIENKMSRYKKTNLIFSTIPQDLYSSKIMPSEENNLAPSVDQISLSEFDEMNVYETPTDLEDKGDLESANAAKVGRVGEEVVFRLIKDGDHRLSLIPNLESFKWVNEKTESHKPFDFKTGGLEWKFGDKIIEVKASEKDESGRFILSSNERDKLLGAPGNYWLIKVNGIDVDFKTFESIVVYTGKDILEMTFDVIQSYFYKEKDDKK